jgi:hypothetical protein
MAYGTTSNLPAGSSFNQPFAITTPVAGGAFLGSTNTGGTVWVFKTTDVFSTVTGNSFITNGFSLGMRPFDPVLHIDTTNSLMSWTFVTAVTTQASGAQGGGAATLSSVGIALSTH